MQWLRSRLVLLLTVFVAAAALFVVQARAQFGQLIVRSAGNRSAQLTLSDARHPAGALYEIEFMGDGLTATLQPGALPVAGTQAPARLTLREGTTVFDGVVVMDVQEAGQFLSAQVHGSVGTWNLSGGFRLKLATPVGGPLPAAALVQLH